MQLYPFIARKKAKSLKFIVVNLLAKMPCVCACAEIKGRVAVACTVGATNLALSKVGLSEIAMVCF